MSVKEDLARLARLLKERAVQPGPVFLHSARWVEGYVDARLLTLSPDGLLLASRLLLDSLPPEVEAVGGPTLGADPLVSAMCLLSAIQTRPPLRGFLVRKDPKAHGRRALIEGPVEAGMKVALVDDVVTSGHSLQQAALAAYDAHLEVIAVRCLVDREAGWLDVLGAVTDADVQALLRAQDVGLEPLTTGLS